MAIDKERKTGF